MNSFLGPSAVGVLLFLWPFHATATIYRCTSPGKPVSYQGTPCEGAEKQRVIASPVSQAQADIRVQPTSGLSNEQRIAYDGLLMDYYDMFGVLGRAKACGLDPMRYQQVLKNILARLEKRHGDKDFGGVGEMALAGLEAGAENRDSGLGRPGVTPPAKIPCAEALTRAQNLRLPAVPASLVSRGGDQPVTTQIAEFGAATGDVRILKKDVGGGHYLVLHRNREVFDSPHEIDFYRLMEGAVPALLLGVADPDAHCYDPGARVNLRFAIITLPARGASVTTPFDFHCMNPDVYDKYNTNYICFRDNTQARRESQVFRIDETGKPVLFGKFNWQACPSPNN
jgi:hypothetical protein